MFFLSKYIQRIKDYYFTQKSIISDKGANMSLEQHKNDYNTKKTTTPFFIQHCHDFGGSEPFTNEFIVTPLGEGKTEEEIHNDYLKWIELAKEVDRDDVGFCEDEYGTLWEDLGYSVEGMHFKFSNTISDKGVNE